MLTELIGQFKRLKIASVSLLMLLSFVSCYHNLRQDYLGELWENSIIVIKLKHIPTHCMCLFKVHRAPAPDVAMMSVSTVRSTTSTTSATKRHQQRPQSPTPTAASTVGCVELPRPTQHLPPPLWQHPRPLLRPLKRPCLLLRPLRQPCIPQRPLRHPRPQQRFKVCLMYSVQLKRHQG